MIHLLLAPESHWCNLTNLFSMIAKSTIIDVSMVYAPGLDVTG